VGRRHTLGVLHMLHLSRRAQLPLPQPGHVQSPSLNRPSAVDVLCQVGVYHAAGRALEPHEAAASIHTAQNCLRSAAQDARGRGVLAWRPLGRSRSAAATSAPSTAAIAAITTAAGTATTGTAWLDRAALVALPSANSKQL
jgi:hypothetical protein